MQMRARFYIHLSSFPFLHAKILLKLCFPAACVEDGDDSRMCPTEIVTYNKTTCVVWHKVKPCIRSQNLAISFMLICNTEDRHKDLTYLRRYSSFHLKCSVSRGKSIQTYRGCYSEWKLKLEHESFTITIFICSGLNERRFYCLWWGIIEMMDEMEVACICPCINNRMIEPRVSWASLGILP